MTEKETKNIIEENIEKGLEAIEDVAEDVEEAVKKIAKKVKEAVSGNAEKETVEDSENVTEVVKKVVKKTTKKEISTESPGEEKEESLEDKKKKLLEKVKKLKKKVDGDKISSEELKEKVKIKKREDMLIPLEEYVKSGIYLGTKVVTPAMRPFVYRRRADGLAIFNTDLIDEKLKEAIEYLNGFEAKDIILACKRQAGWRVAEMFSKLTGIRVFTKKYPAGVLTNTQLEDFFENELTIVCDSWLDKNALNDTINVKKKVLMVCDTNNFSKGADQIIIGNNKSAKSLGVIFYLLARGYCKNKKIECDIPDLDWWTEEEGAKGTRVQFGV